MAQEFRAHLLLWLLHRQRPTLEGGGKQLWAPCDLPSSPFLGGGSQRSPSSKTELSDVLQRLMQMGRDSPDAAS